MKQNNVIVHQALCNDGGARWAWLISLMSVSFSVVTVIV